MLELDVGSVLLSSPEKTDIKNSIIHMKWKISVPELGQSESVFLVKEIPINEHTRTLMWINIYSHLFPEHVVEDAKRFAYDLSYVGFLSRIKQQFCAMICLNMSCIMHGINFFDKKQELIAAKGEARTIFGLESRKYTIRSKQFSNLKRYTEMAMEIIPEETFDLIKRMHEKAGDINGD